LHERARRAGDLVCDDDGNVFFARKVSSKFLGRRKISSGSLWGGEKEREAPALGKARTLVALNLPSPIGSSPNSTGSWFRKLRNPSA
jgi:hypothetical protein